MKLGYAKAVFTVISTSALDTYLEASKKLRDTEIALVEYGETSLPDVDVAVIAGFKTFMDCASSIHDGMVIVVCGGPLQVESIPHAIPLDYEKSLSYVFDLIPMDFSKVRKAIKSKKTEPVKVKSITMKHLSLIIDNTATGGVLTTDWNRLMSILNGIARQQCRLALINIIMNDAPPSHLAEQASFLYKTSPHYSYLERVLTALKSKQFKVVKDIIKQSFDAKSVDSLMRKAKIEEDGKFEIIFFRKMIMSHNFNERKKSIYEPINK